MAKRNVEPKFLPCVGTHYRNVTETMVKRLADVEEGILEHNGHLEPQILEALEQAKVKVLDLVLALDAKSSKKKYGEGCTVEETAS